MFLLQKTIRLSLALLATLSAVPPARTATLSTQQQGGQTDSTPQQAPRGKVLFERHDASPVDDSSIPAQTDPAEPAKLKNGISSSRKNPRTLQRRGQTEAQQQAPETVVEPAVPIVSSSSDAASAALPIVMTEADRIAASRVSDEERSALSVVATSLDVHLNAHTGEVEARAQVTVRNTGSTPLQHLPLRISGALHWESARLAGSTAALPLEQHRLEDDLDHTGAATELAIVPGEPLAPGATVALDLYYGGTLAARAQRLIAIGAPTGAAALTDWDTVSDTFTGLRGEGSVLWYPVAGTSALLRNGDAVPRAVELSRHRNANTPFDLRLTLEYAGLRPDAAFFCGERQPLHALADGEKPGNDGGVVTAEWKRASLGLHTPSLFLAEGAPQPVADGLLRVETDRADTAAALGEAAARVRPMLAAWLGAAPARPLDVLDLPVPGGAGFADGALLVAPLTNAPAASLAPTLVQPMASVWLPDGIAAPWLHDGLPAFLQEVWAERSNGRDAALAGFAATMKRLTTEQQPEAYSSSQPVETPAGPALATCAAPACARGKAAYVFEMLRNMLGDSALQQAVSGWRVQQEQANSGAAEETAAMESMLQRAAGNTTLDWFFSNWIDQNRGLPDLTIVTVAPRRVERSAPVNYLPQRKAPVAGPIGAEPVPQAADPRDLSNASSEVSSSSNGPAPAAGSWLVAVEVQNNGTAEAQVPVTVRAGGLTNTLPLRVPAHGRATIRVPFEAEPSEVLVNDGSVPETRNTLHRRTLNNLPADR